MQKLVVLCGHGSSPAGWLYAWAGLPAASTAGAGAAPRLRSHQPLAGKPSLWPICSGSPLFQDERLQALISTALENNYDVRIAVARVLEAAGATWGDAVFPAADR